MTIDFSYLAPLVIIGFISLVVGAIVGFLVAGLRTASRSAKPKRNRDLIEVMRIWHDRRSKELSMEIGGKIYKKVTDLSEKSRRGFVALLNEMQSWSGLPDIERRLGDVTSRTLAVTGQPPPKTTPVGSDSSVQAAPPTTTITLSEKQLVEKEVENQSLVLNQEIPTVNLTLGETTETRPRKFIFGKPKELSKEIPKELKSIAVQVDEILQEKLADSPQITQAIRLLELPGKGVAVMVNNTQYEGVGEVPDPDVRQIIQASVAEWERRLSAKQFTPR